MTKQRKRGKRNSGQRMSNMRGSDPQVRDCMSEQVTESKPLDENTTDGNPFRDVAESSEPLLTTDVLEELAIKDATNEFEQTSHSETFPDPRHPDPESYHRQIQEDYAYQKYGKFIEEKDDIIEDLRNRIDELKRQCENANYRALAYDEQRVYEVQKWQVLQNEKMQLEQENRALRKMKSAYDRLQSEALASVDRFQPVVDEAIIAEFNGIDVKSRSVVNHLMKKKSTLDSNHWEKVVLDYIWRRSYNEAAGKIRFEDRDVRKKIIKSIVWKFWDFELFRAPFQAFGGETAVRLREVYKKLYRNPHDFDDSAKWRQIAIQRLLETETDASTKPAHDAQVLQHLTGSFQALTEALGYDAEDKELLKKFHDMALKALKLAQTLAGQRAIFYLHDAAPENYGVGKTALDGARVNVDESGEFDDEVEEREGTVWFTIKPGLEKCGTGRGDNLNRSTLLIKSLVQLVEE